MTDVYLWDETYGASDVVLRTSAAVAVSVSSGGKPRRHMGESMSNPTPRGVGHLNFTLTLWGEGTIEARGELAAAVAMTSDSAHVAFAARHTFTASVAIAAQTVTASDHINLRVSLAAIHPDDDELLELLELIRAGGTP